ncbi:Cna B-type domain-containing protein [Vagococcus acidifermentans]|nr:Cna B-type domain-containing protein [Vagococcus acidifermentans]
MAIKNGFRVLSRVVASLLMLGVMVTSLLIPEKNVNAASDISGLITQEKNDFYVIHNGKEEPVVIDGVEQVPRPDFTVGDEVKFIYRYRIDDLSSVNDGDYFDVTLPNQEYIHIPDSSLLNILDNSTGDILGTWQIKNGKIHAVLNEKAALSDSAENGYFMFKGNLLKEGTGIEIEVDGNLTIEIDIEPDPNDKPDDPEQPVDIPELPERFDDFYKEGKQFSNQNVIHWNTSFNLDELRNMFNGDPIQTKQKMMFIDELAPQTFLAGIPAINVPVYVPTRDGKLGDLAHKTIDLVEKNLAVEMTPQKDEGFDQFYERMETSGKVAYGIHDNTLLISFGTVPGNGITYYDLFGGQAGFEAYVDSLVTDKVIDQKQAEKMKEVYSPSGPSNGNIVGLGVSFDVDVRGVSGEYVNKAKLKWVEGNDETNEVIVEFFDVHGGLEIVKTGCVLIKKIDGDTKEKLSDVTFKLQKKDDKGEYLDYTPKDGVNERKTDSNGEVMFTRLDNGEYRIVEVSVPEGYSDEKIVIRPNDGYFTINNETDKEGFTFDVSNYKQPTSRTVKKVWVDGDNQDGLRPESIQVQLHKNDAPYGKAVTLNEANNWSHTWSDLPEKENGKDIVYTVKETGGVTGYTTSTAVTGQIVTLTNTHTPEVVQIKGKKTWHDDNNNDGKRPDKIIVNLLADGQVIDSQEVTEADNWSYTFKDLAKYANGKGITYTVTENAVADYTTEINGYDITNRYTPKKTSRSVQKVWVDGDNQDGLRPESIQVQLHKNDAPYGKAVTLNEANNWSHTWSDLPEKENGKDIVYTVKETGDVTGYTTSTAVTGQIVTLTNTHTPEVVQIKGKKTWHDDNNNDGKRPDKIIVNLLADGQVIDSQEVTAADNWSYTFKDLAKYANGKGITYTVTEEAVLGYSTEVSGYDIMNTYTPKKTSRSVQKVWVDGDNQDGLRPESIQVQLHKNDVPYGKAVTLDEANNWSHTWSDLPEKENGKDIVYTVKETGDVTGYTTSTAVTGQIVTLTNTHTPEVVQIKGKKTWHDDNNNAGKRPDKILVNLLADGQVIDSQEVTEADNWSYTFKDLAKYAGGKGITYTVTEEAVPGYSTEVSGYDIMNTYTPKKTNRSVQKVWVDGDNQDGLRPESIQVQLHKNDAPYGKAVTLNEANNWSHTWSDLPEKENGKDIVYTVKETDGVTGYTTSTAVTGQIVTLTNTHTPEVVQIKGKKTWHDDNNTDGKRPDKILVNLLADGQVIDSQEVTEADNWSYTFKDLAKYANGKHITYTVTENAVADYTTEIDGYDITNTYAPKKTSVRVTKFWNDEKDLIKLRPEMVKVQLLADGKEQGKEIILNQENNWTYCWENVALVNQQGEEISYTVQEKDVPIGYIQRVDDNDKGNIILCNTVIKKKAGDLPSTPSQAGKILPKSGEKNNGVAKFIGLLIVGIGLLIYIFRNKKVRE